MRNTLSVLLLALVATSLPLSAADLTALISAAAQAPVQQLKPAYAKAAAVDIRKSEPWETTHSGNSVSLEQELINAGDVNRAYKLNTSIAKTFHRMLLASAKV